jgi:hypothetical protein
MRGDEPVGRGPLIAAVRPIQRVVMPQGLNTGDKVVELASVAIAAAVLAGAIAGGWSTWFVKRGWLMSGGAFIAGGVLGFLIGMVVGNALYRDAVNTVIVKAGSESLRATLPAGLAGGVAGAATTTLIVALLSGTLAQATFLGVGAIGCGIVAGVLLACMSSLL